MGQQEQTTLKRPPIDRFLIKETIFDQDFVSVAQSVDLHRPCQILRARLPVDSGCYFWIMRWKSVRYKIYLGRTRSLQKRVKDYQNPFQIHSPNDFKLRFFQEFMASAFPDAALDLYFKKLEITYCKGEETRLIQLYRPLINVQGKPTDAERQIIRRAFGDYYASVTRRMLTDEASSPSI